MPLNYTFGERPSLAKSKKIPESIPIQKVRGRRTWTEKTGYNFEEVYEGHHADINRAFDDPRFVCGANQVIAQRDHASEKASMTVSFGHRTKFESILNLAQPEEFKSVWTFEPSVETLPIWRHPAYIPLDYRPYESGVNYPLARQIWLAVNQYLRAWEDRFGLEVREAIRNIPIDQPDIRFLRLFENFDIFHYVKAPEFGTEEEKTNKRALAVSMANNLLYGRSTFTVFRYILKNTSVVASNSGYSFGLTGHNNLYTSPDMARIVAQNVFGLEAARSRTPAGCRPVTAPKRALIRDLITGFKNVSWLSYPATTTELTNGSIEVVRMWVERFAFEIDTNITPFVPWGSHESVQPKEEGE